MTQKFRNNTWVGECALHDLSSYLVANIEGAGNMQEKTFSELLRDLLQFKSQPGGTLIAKMTIDEISNLVKLSSAIPALLHNSTGALIAASIPDSIKPEKAEGNADVITAFSCNLDSF